MIRYPLLIGLAGPARCGKSTAQALLAEEFGLVRLNFADPIKDALTTMLDIDFHSLEGAAKEEPLYHLGRSPRELMQTLGTEWGRELCGSDWWIKVAERRLAMFEGIEGDAYSGAVISDVRFNEEADWLRNRGGGPPAPRGTRAGARPANSASTRAPTTPGSATTTTSASCAARSSAR